MVGLKKICLVSVGSIPEDKVFSQMSNKWVEDNCFCEYNSIDAFLLDFNAELLNDKSSYARAIYSKM